MQMTDAAHNTFDARSAQKNGVESDVDCYAGYRTAMLRCEQLTWMQAEQAVDEEEPQHQCRPSHWPGWHHCWALHASLLLAL